MYGINSGTTIGPYVLDAQLGAGGQGSVWQAHNTDPSSANQSLAVKIIPIRGSAPTMVERVRRESEALMRLSKGHPSICECLGVVEDPVLGVLAVAMEKIEGAELEKAMRSPRCTEDMRMMALEHVAKALAYLHDAGFVHRDIKPPNILVKNSFFDAPLDPTNVKLVDFGIAIPTGNPSPLTEVGTVIGTPAYMPPERIDPLFWRSVSGVPSEDVFAFGVVAYEALFERHPSGLPDDSRLGDYAEKYRAISRDPGAWPLIPEGHRWTNVIKRALTLKANDRLINGGALVALIQGASATVSDAGFAKAPTQAAFAAIQPPPPAAVDASSGRSGKTSDGEPQYEGPPPEAFLPSPAVPPLNPSFPSMADAPAVVLPQTPPPGQFSPATTDPYHPGSTDPYSQQPAFVQGNTNPGLANVPVIQAVPVMQPGPPMVPIAPGVSPHKPKTTVGGIPTGAAVAIGLLLGIGVPATIMAIYQSQSTNEFTPMPPVSGAPGGPVSIDPTPTPTPEPSGTGTSTLPHIPKPGGVGGAAGAGQNPGVGGAAGSPAPSASHTPIVIGPHGGTAGASGAGGSSSGASGAAGTIPTIIKFPPFFPGVGGNTGGASGASGAAGASGASGAAGSTGAGGAAGSGQSGAAGRGGASGASGAGGRPGIGGRAGASGAGGRPSGAGGRGVVIKLSQHFEALRSRAKPLYNHTL